MWVWRTRWLFPLAVAAKEACEFIGQPECELNLAHAVIYLATAPKSNTTTAALGKVKREIANRPIQEVPTWLKDSHGKAAKALGLGKGYLYSHEFPEAISGQDYLLVNKQFYTPGSSGREKFIAERLAYWKELKEQLRKNT